MFEKIKEKVKNGKEWAKDHKTEIAYVVGCFAGAIATCVVYSYDDKKKAERMLESYGPEMKVLSMKPQADYIDGIYGSGITRLDELSDKLIYNGGVADSKVIGALVYTKK